MAGRSEVLVRFLGDTKSLEVAAARASASVEAVGRKSEESSGKFAKFGALGVAGLAVVGVAAVKLGMDFQETTSAIQGNAQITAAAADSIGQAFLNTAGKSTFSGQEMSTAFAPVAGVIQSVEGHALTAADALLTMKAATTLAEASGGDLKTTTATLASVMLAFHIKATGAADATNLLFNASRVTGVTVEELAGSINKLHGKLGIAAPTLADMSTLVVDLAEHGISGSRGLMVLNAGMSSLLSGSKGTSKELATLGVHIFDAHGKFVGMSSVLSQLGPKFAGMSDAQRHAAEAALFGKNAASALDATLRAGAVGYAKAAAEATKHAAAEKAAQARAATLAGEIKTLKATVTDWVTELGTKLIPMIQSAIGWISKHSGEAKLLAAIIGVVMVAAMATWVASVVIGAATSVAAAVSTAAAWVAANAAMILASGGIILAVAALVLAGLWLFKHWHKIWADIKLIVGDAVQWVKDRWHTVLGFFGTVIGGIKTVFGKVVDFITLPFRMAFNVVADLWNGTLGKMSFKLPSWIPGIGGKGFSMPTIPHLAQGGIVSSPTLALIGEAGPEAVVPLGRGGFGGGGSGGIHIHLGDGIIVGTPADVGLAVQRALLALKNRTGTNLGIA